MYAGRQLSVFHCSSQVSQTTVLNFIRGMAATGKGSVVHAHLLYTRTVNALSQNILFVLIVTFGTGDHLYFIIHTHVSNGSGH